MTLYEHDTEYCFYANVMNESIGISLASSSNNQTELDTTVTANRL